MREALRLKPDSSLAHAGLCGMFISQGNLDEGETHCKETIRIEPDNALGHLGLGQVLEQRGDLHAALLEFLAADRLASDLPRQVREFIRQKIEAISSKVEQ
jgi:tetratricopeptide (TPR) repeat protein